MNQPGTPKFIDEPEELDPDAEGGGSWLGRALLAAIVLPSFAIWGYAYSGLANRPEPDLLDETGFVNAAGPICQAAMEEFESRPGPLEAIDHIDRAAQIRDSNILFNAMLDNLEAVKQGTPPRCRHHRRVAHRLARVH